MKCKKLCLSAVFFLVMGISGLYAQEAVPTSGGEASGGGGTASYSVGQLVFNAIEGNGNSVSQGVQQPLEISVVSGLNEAKFISLTCLAYPNPATDFVNLRIENYPSGNLEYRLFDVGGALVDQGKIDGNEIQISMKTLTPSTYFLKVLDQGRNVRTFKVIKK